MYRSALEKIWESSVHCFEEARLCLPVMLPTIEAESAWASAQEYIHRNEHELALDEMVALGDICSAKVEFWRYLIFAAKNMGLTEHEIALQKKL